ncbi:MAG TPA: hypothetical protein VKU02_30940 [Gemmataceae bacterium]|nr:hypothetical protein [Gemmataceae bacterium]
MLSANPVRMEVLTRILNPAEAEVRITADPVDLSAEAELRGRLVGPRCPYATTVEVAYPLRPVPGPRPPSGDVTARVIIPEPSFWDLETPFLYHGSVELWKAGNRCNAVEVRHGLRMLQLGKSGLRCNGRALLIRGVSHPQLQVEDARQFRRDGYNTLLAPVSAETADLWDAADQWGFLVLGRLPGTTDAIRCAEILKFHASCLGWLLTADAQKVPGELARLQDGTGSLLGLELDRPLSEPLSQPFQFIFAKEEYLPRERTTQPPVLLQLPRSAGEEERKQALASSGILGWIAD